MVCVLISVILIILAVYFLHFKPKQKKEERKISKEFFETDESEFRTFHIRTVIQSLETIRTFIIVLDTTVEIPERPLTTSEAARIQAEKLMRANPSYGTQRPRTADIVGSARARPRPGTAQHAGIPLQRPGTASQRPGTASQRPGTALQRPGTASQRPGTASQRPVTASQRPGTTSQRPGTASQQSGTASHPGTASQQSGTASEQTGTAMQNFSLAKTTLAAASAFQNTDSPIEIHATHNQKSLYDNILNEEKLRQLSTTHTSGLHTHNPGNKIMLVVENVLKHQIERQTFYF